MSKEKSMKLVHKVMNFELERVDSDERSFWAVASTGGVDRQGDEIDPLGWDLENFMKNPVIAWAHDYTRPPVAKALEVRPGPDGLLFKAQFAKPEEYAFADTVFKLYLGGFLKAFSVGFSPLASEIAVRQTDGKTITGTRYLKQELYEISCVTLPANPDALVALGQAQGPGGQLSPLPAKGESQKEELAAALIDRLVQNSLARRMGLEGGPFPITSKG